MAAGQFEKGDAIIVNGSAAKDGSNLANAKTVSWPMASGCSMQVRPGIRGTPGAQVQ